MGCANSKEPVCRNCQTPFSPVTRSYSMHVHHPPQREGDSYHVVALTSSTLGSLKLDPINHSHRKNRDSAPVTGNGDRNGNGGDKKRREDFSMGVIEAKAWSKMIDEKIPKVVPKTPVRTPPGEPETINAWELMEGLEDTSPVRPPNHLRSFSFHVAPNSLHSPDNLSRSKPAEETGEESPKQTWADDESNSNSNRTSIISEFDPEVISTFRKALEELPPANPFHLKPMGNERLDAFLPPEVVDVKKSIDDLPTFKLGRDRVILYFTSLRGVRKTYEDCCHVRVILKGTGVRVDERDVSMHSGFKEELRDLLGDGFHGGCLPRVFVGKKYIGGPEEIQRLHEEGQLEKLLDGCEMVDDGGGGGGPCEACGDIRFVPCETCSGSCKIFYEVEYEEEAEESEDIGFQRCPDCNENGLTRCPLCCD